jgi:hypothetical protein
MQLRRMDPAHASSPGMESASKWDTTGRGVARLGAGCRRYQREGESG